MAQHLTLTTGVALRTQIIFVDLRSPSYYDSVVGLIKLPRPTDSELEILRVLWNRGPSTVRDVFDDLNQSKPTGYTTVLKLMQIMADKKLVKRNEKQRAHVYEAQLPEEQTQNQLLGDLLNRAFAGSASRLVMRALSSTKTSKQDLVEIRRMIDDMEDRAK